MYADNCADAVDRLLIFLQMGKKGLSFYYPKVTPQSAANTTDIIVDRYMYGPCRLSSESIPPESVPSRPENVTMKPRPYNTSLTNDELCKQL